MADAFGSLSVSLIVRDRQSRSNARNTMKRLAENMRTKVPVAAGLWNKERRHFEGNPIPQSEGAPYFPNGSIVRPASIHFYVTFRNECGALGLKGHNVAE